MKKQWSIVLLIALILLVVIFSVMNVDPVAINFGFSIIQVPLVLVIIVTLLLGVLIAVILSTTIILQNKNEQKKLSRRLTEIEDEKQREKDELKDRKSTRLNSSHVAISYAVFCFPCRLATSTLFPYTTLFRSILALVLFKYHWF